MSSFNRSVVAAALATVLLANAVLGLPTAVDSTHAATYHGLDRNGIEIFLNIPYGEDTGGKNRFKPPKLYVPTKGSTIEATSYGPACPQPVGDNLHLPLGMNNITKVSEDCLNLNIARPKGTTASSRLPVLLWIHGGSLWFGSNSEPTNSPDGMILESVANGLPIIHVAINYRVGFFGFAQSDALRQERSENAGLRDQRLAIEWVRDNIHNFGGDRERITIHGQSSGGLGVGMQILAHGGTKPVPFQRAIIQSQALDVGITSNWTTSAMALMANHPTVSCNTSALHSPQTIECLRKLDTQTLLDASIATYVADVDHNIGDVWLPSVDGDFLPAAPSQLGREGRFAKKLDVMIGWTENDMLVFTRTGINTPALSRDFIARYFRDVSASNIDKLLALYPTSDFVSQVPAGIPLSPEFYRTGRICRDILMACQPMWLGVQLARTNANNVYLYDWNQTILEAPLGAISGGLFSSIGPVHTSEFAYVFGNLSAYDVQGYPFHPTEEDRKLVTRGSRSWSNFVAMGDPVGKGDTFKGFERSFVKGKDDVSIYVAGGPHEGLSAMDGSKAEEALAQQKLRERCAFINSDEMIAQLRY